jgi:galactose-1-phosphate uridylyltransferase
LQKIKRVFRIIYNKELAANERIIFQNDDFVLIPFWVIWSFAGLLSLKKSAKRYLEYQMLKPKNFAEEAILITQLYDKLFQTLFRIQVEFITPTNGESSIRIKSFIQTCHNSPWMFGSLKEI